MSSHYSTVVYCLTSWSTERDALGCDEYHPISHRGGNITRSGGIGYTVADALDTMYIMGLGAEFQRARKWVKEELSFDRKGDYSVFEVSDTTV
jgi:endoplasmic reticulum Man9GlcNAc2 1,2-alpha-mannosidase